MTHAIIYDRASTKLQEDNFSRVNAKEIGIRIAEQHGFTWEYIKEIGSGTTLTGRPKMLAILDRIAAGEVQALIVQDLDRLARPVERASYEAIRNICFSNDVKIYTHTSGVIDFADDDSDFFADLQMAFAKKERQRMLKRTKRSRKARADAGKFVGGVPIGYRIVGVASTADLEIDPAGATVVQLIFDTIEANFGNLLKTTKELNAMGYTGIRGRKFTARTMRRIVTRRLYIGIFESTVTDKITHRPDLQIISVSQFEHVQRLIKSRAGNNKDMGRRGHYVFTGFIVCGGCGGAMVAGRRGNRVVYQCRSHRFKTGCTCGKNYSEHLILPPIIDFLAGFIQTNIDFRNTLAETAAQYGKTVVEEALEASYHGELATIHAGKDRIISAIGLGIISTQEAAASLEDYREQEQEIIAQLARITEKTAIQDEWQTILDAFNRKDKDVKTSLTGLAQDEPLAFRRILSIVFKPNSLKVRTEHPKLGIKKWRGVLEGYEITEAMKNDVKAMHGTSVSFGALLPGAVQ